MGFMKMALTGFFLSSSRWPASIGFVLRTKTRHAAFPLRAASTSAVDLQNGISRLETLQTLLSRHGAPGSMRCNEPNDLEPVFVCAPSDDTPELISSIMGWDEYKNLHPQLVPLARSQKTGNFICALRRAFADDPSALYKSSSDAPWPIVEAKPGGIGMRLLSLNSEHLMRRIVCECDVSGKDSDLISLYNKGLGENAIIDMALDTPYEPGSVDKLGYGVDKYVLLRVGPFADIYENLAMDHAKKGDEPSALISAEAANNKIVGFGSTFLFYARLLKSFPHRDEEARDAARMCLRLPLPSIGMSDEEFKDVAVLGQIAQESDSMSEVMAKLQAMYEKMRQHEQEEDPRTSQAKTIEQLAIDEANYLLDTAALSGGNWNDIRYKLAEIYKAGGRDDMASFVCPTS